MMLDREFKYYLDNQERLFEQYKDKFIVIKDNEVIGAYESELTAYLETKKEHEEGTFLIQLCQLGEDNYTQNFHSLAIF